MSDRQAVRTLAWVIGLILVLFVVTYAMGYNAGTRDTWAEVGLYEDGSYSSGCRPGGLCERP